VLFYRAVVDVSRSTPNYVTGLIRRRRKTIGSIRRRLKPGQQVLLVPGPGERANTQLKSRPRSFERWAIAHAEAFA
jgi:hypothetical protein